MYMRKYEQDDKIANITKRPMRANHNWKLKGNPPKIQLTDNVLASVLEEEHGNQADADEHDGRCSNGDRARKLVPYKHNDPSAKQNKSARADPESAQQDLAHDNFSLGSRPTDIHFLAFDHLKNTLDVLIPGVGHLDVV